MEIEAPPLPFLILSKQEEDCRARRNLTVVIRGVFAHEHMSISLRFGCVGETRGVNSGKHTFNIRGGVATTMRIYIRQPRVTNRSRDAMVACKTFDKRIAVALLGGKNRVASLGD